MFSIHPSVRLSSSFLSIGRFYTCSNFSSVVDLFWMATISNRLPQREGVNNAGKSEIIPIWNTYHD